MRKYEAVLSCGISLVFIAEDDAQAKRIASAHAKKGEEIKLYNGKEEGGDEVWRKESGAWTNVSKKSAV